MGWINYVNYLSDDDFRKLYQILNRIHMYVISIACLDKKLFVLGDWSFSLFLHSLAKSLQKFYTGFVKENIPKNDVRIAEDEPWPT